jgi:hypothetical protein
LQTFNGEDKNMIERKKKQQEQLREWTKQQIQEKQERQKREAELER